VTSPFYRDKFLGLADQFPGGCSVVDLDGTDVSARLRASIRAAWELAEPARDDLRAAAGRQVEASRAAYARAKELIEQRRG
jgi:colanic acid/amylovoran biosynthesis protein